MTVKKIDGLEIEPEAFKPRKFYWRVQWIAYVLMLILLLAVFFGLGGPGIFGFATLTDPTGSFQIRYDRMTRQQSENNLELSIKIPPLGNHNRIVKVWANQAYMKTLFIKQMTPRPMYEEITGDKIIYHFLTAAHNDHLTITIMAEPSETGWLTAQFGVMDGGPMLEFKQFVYP